MAVEEVQRINANSTGVWSQEKNPNPPDVETQPKTAQAAAVQADAAAATAKKQETADEKKRVEEAARQLNEFMKRNSIQLKFSVDGDTHEIVVKVVQKQTGKVIRQIPSEEALKIAKAFELGEGTLVKEKA